MKLKTIKRDPNKKSETNRLRREGFIPAIMYHNGKAGDAVAVSAAEYDAIIRSIKPGHLPTQKITLVFEGKNVDCVIKEIQYHPTTYRVLHLDFEHLDAGVPVNVKVPIECTGVLDCVGIKLGGVLRQVIRHLPVRCLPKDIPGSFQVDTTSLNLGDSVRLKHLAIPETVRPLKALNEVAVVVARK